MNQLYSIIKSEIDKTQSIAIELIKNGIDQKDVRVAFFELFQNLYIVLYRVYSYIDSEQFKKDSEQIYFYIQGKDDKKDKINLIANLNYNLIIDTWSTFELCISQICKKILPPESNDKLLKSNFNRTMKIIKTGLSSELIEDLLLNQKLKYIEHVSINLKTDQIFNIAQYQAFQLDKKFLLFYGKCRNSIHSNYVYYGKPFSFKFKGVTFTFEPEKPIKQEPVNWEQDLSIFYLTVELREIYFRIISNFKYDGLIFDPSFADTI